jgi:hypothetical protein
MSQPPSNSPRTYTCTATQQRVTRHIMLNRANNSSGVQESAQSSPQASHPNPQALSSVVRHAVSKHTSFTSLKRCCTVWPWPHHRDSPAGTWASCSAPSSPAAHPRLTGCQRCQTPDQPTEAHPPPFG